MCSCQSEAVAFSDVLLLCASYSYLLIQWHSGQWRALEKAMEYGLVSVAVAIFGRNNFGVIINNQIFHTGLQGYVIVYDVTNESSFQCMDRLKKLIEKNKEKREVWYGCLILIGLHWSKLAYHSLFVIVL